MIIIIIIIIVIISIIIIITIIIVIIIVQRLRGAPTASGPPAASEGPEHWHPNKYYY